MYSVIDCGTTNTKVYIVDENHHIIARNFKKVGVRDTAITGSRQVLKEGLREAVLTALSKKGLQEKDIEFALVFGMITSEIGLKEIPHLIGPAGLEDLAASMVKVHDIEVFPVDIPIYFIRGIKNDYGNIGLEGIRKIDFMRGEETQVMGILEKYTPKLPLNVLVLSSHTKLIHVDDCGRITGSVTTLSGQVYEAIKKETFIGKCLQEDCPKENEQDKSADYFPVEILEIAFQSVYNAGFLRTMIMPRFMQNLLQTTWYERKFFVDAAIAAEDMKIMKEAQELLKFDLNTGLVLVGHRERCRIYEHLLKGQGFNRDIRCIWDKEDIDQLAVAGSMAVAGKAGVF